MGRRAAPAVNYLRNWRELFGLTLAQLAQRIKQNGEATASGQSMGNLEAGRRRLSTEWLDRIAKAYGIDVDMLLLEPKKTKLRKLRLEVGTDIAQLSAASGISPYVITRMEWGLVSMQDNDREKLAEALGCEEDDLRDDYFSNMEMKQASEETMMVLDAQQAVHNSPAIIELEVRAGMGSGDPDPAMVNHTDGNGHVQNTHAVKGIWHMPPSYIGEIDIDPRDIRIIEVWGDSMLPTLSSGDRVMINTKDRYPRPGGLFALWDGHGVAVKRLELVGYGDKPKKLRIISDNPLHGVDEVDPAEVHISGRVVWRGTRM